MKYVFSPFLLTCLAFCTVYSQSHVLSVHKLSNCKTELDFIKYMSSETPFELSSSFDSDSGSSTWFYHVSEEGFTTNVIFSSEKDIDENAIDFISITTCDFSVYESILYESLSSCTFQENLLSPHDNSPYPLFLCRNWLFWIYNHGISEGCYGKNLYEMQLF